ncbi:GRAS family protein [Myxococcus sp. K15C18031901]|uniref:GRAS family protein n=1 Tax=Myxococcus dinghuensis TaxID=2906761 RepID=UPI0020A6F6D7|nr:GRAS family protein [Myxococcus dinghuensis]MCP3102694.1 GRAS family protein [Myxococcus dinghuensis]
MHTAKDELLFRGMERALAGRPDEARAALASLTGLLDVEAEPQDLDYQLFASAIARRLDDTRPGPRNPYLHPPPDAGGRQIDLFRLLMAHMPLAATADALANATLVELLGGHDEATLVDVGMGQGRQEARLLRRLAERGALPRRLTLVGVDPSGDSLAQAEVTVADVAREVGAEVVFEAWVAPVERVSGARWARLGGLPRPLVVNAAFSLHHVAEAPGSEGAARDAVLRHLRALEPSGLVLCEPNVDHFLAPPLERFAHAWNHFTHVFQLLDTLPVPREARVAIKRFYGREVDDVVGTVDESARCERHELARTWGDRLRRAGFAPLEALARVSVPVHPALTTRREPGMVGLCWRDELLVAVLGARPAVEARP